MKTSASITWRNEDFARATTTKFPSPVNETPFADLMLHPEKLEAALKTTKRENDAFEASRTFGRSTINSATRTVSPANNGACQPSSHASANLKPAEFHLGAPSAKSVKLAADFTEWEKFPLDMMKSEDGLWFITVPLPPGSYSYRFIVDGQWHDDPRPNKRVPNPFGTINAVVEVR
jgi:hypothetical protein